VAGTALSTTYGVAKQAIVHSVRVLDCAGQGRSSGLLLALNWIAENVERPAIINASFGGPRSDLMDAAIAETVSRGILTVAAAGNDTANACTQSPASAPAVITVGATDPRDRQAGFSNYGSCLDTWAPGVGISSVGLLGQESVLSGTSMAAPAVTGVAAVLWSLYPTADAADITNLVIKSATTDTLSLSKPGSPAGIHRTTGAGIALSDTGESTKTEVRQDHSQQRVRKVENSQERWRRENHQVPNPDQDKREVARLAGEEG